MLGETVPEKPVDLLPVKISPPSEYLVKGGKYTQFEHELVEYWGGDRRKRPEETVDVRSPDVGNRIS